MSNAKYHASAPTYSDGDLGDLQLDANGNLKTTLATTIAGEDTVNDVLKIEQRNSFTNITSATTTVVKSGAGFLHAITVNTTAAGAITIYNNTSATGTKIATIKASVAEQTFTYNVSCSTGLTIVTAAASDITVSYR